MQKDNGPQSLALSNSGTTVYFSERRCASSGAFTASPRKVKSASLYGIVAYNLLYDAAHNTLVASDPAGYLTIYNAPLPAVRQ